MPHTFPASSNAKPSSKVSHALLKEIQLTTRVVTRIIAARPSRRTATPTFSERRKVAVPPRRLTKTI